MSYRNHRGIDCAEVVVFGAAARGFGIRPLLAHGGGRSRQLTGWSGDTVRRSHPDDSVSGNRKVGPSILGCFTFPSVSRASVSRQTVWPTTPFWPGSPAVGRRSAWRSCAASSARSSGRTGGRRDPAAAEDVAQQTFERAWKPA